MSLNFLLNKSSLFVGNSGHCLKLWKSWRDLSRFSGPHHEIHWPHPEASGNSLPRGRRGTSRPPCWEFPLINRSPKIASCQWPHTFFSILCKLLSFQEVHDSLRLLVPPFAQKLLLRNKFNGSWILWRKGGSLYDCVCTNHGPIGSTRSALG